VKFKVKLKKKPWCQSRQSARGRGWRGGGAEAGAGPWKWPGASRHRRWSGAYLGGGVDSDGPPHGHGPTPAVVQTPGQRSTRGRRLASMAVVWRGADAWAQRQQCAAALSQAEGGTKSEWARGSSVHGRRRVATSRGGAQAESAAVAVAKNFETYSILCMRREKREGNKPPVQKKLIHQ
jgi:hypothetical protein